MAWVWTWLAFLAHVCHVAASHPPLFLGGGAGQSTIAGARFQSSGVADAPMRFGKWRKGVSERRRLDLATDPSADNRADVTAGFRAADLGADLKADGGVETHRPQDQSGEDSSRHLMSSVEKMKGSSRVEINNLKPLANSSKMKGSSRVEIRRRLEQGDGNPKRAQLPRGCRSPVFRPQNLIDFETPSGTTAVEPTGNRTADADSLSTDADSLRKFLLLWCWEGQISNRILCFVNHVLLAGFLHRTLVVPPWEPWDPGKGAEASREYNLRAVWDLAHLRRCLGPHAAMSTDEFLKRYQPDGDEVRLDHVHCLAGPKGFCHPDLSDVDAFNCPLLYPAKGENASTDEREFRVDAARLAWGGTFISESSANATGGASCFGRQPELYDVIGAFLSPKSAAFHARVLAVGDVMDLFMQDSHWKLFVNWKKLPIFVQYGGLDPFKRLPGCPNRALVLPPSAVLRRARDVVSRLFGGSPFLSFHWRRGDFLQFCASLKEKFCTVSPSQAAWFLAQYLRRLGISHVFLATNADGAETVEFRKAMQYMQNDTVVRQWTRQDEHLSWVRAADFGVDRVLDGHLLRLSLDKAICALGTVFVGSRISSFTKDIYRLRVGLGTDTTCDTTVHF